MTTPHGSDEEIPSAAGSALLGPMMTRSPAASLALTTAERLQELADQAAETATSGSTNWRHIQAIAGQLSIMARTLTEAERRFAPLQSLSTSGPTLDELANGLDAQDGSGQFRSRT